jgi:hypothetical protein
MTAKQYFPCNDTCPVWFACDHKPVKKCEHRPAQFCKLQLPDSERNGLSEMGKQEHKLRMSMIDGGD